MRIHCKKDKENDIVRRASKDKLTQITKIPKIQCRSEVQQQNNDKLRSTKSPKSLQRHFRSETNSSNPKD
jgi:hypothetical protein